MVGYLGTRKGKANKKGFIYYNDYYFNHLLED